MLEGTLVFEQLLEINFSSSVQLFFLLVVVVRLFMILSLRTHNF